MITINITKDQVAIHDIKRIHRKYPGAVTNALETIVIGVNKIAIDYLSGPGAKKSGIPGGGYPVPVRTGHLRRAENIVLPGKTKSAGGKTYSAGPMGAIAYNAAAYAAAIHEGLGSSRKHGRRPFLTDAVDKYGAARMIKALDKEITKIL